MCSLTPEVIEQCSPARLALLGFKVWNTLGMVEATSHGKMTHPIASGGVARADELRAAGCGP